MFEGWGLARNQPSLNNSTFRTSSAWAQFDQRWGWRCATWSQQFLSLGRLSQLGRTWVKGARPWYDDVEWWGKWIIWAFVSFLRCLDMGVDHFEPQDCHFLWRSFVRGAWQSCSSEFPTWYVWGCALSQAGLDISWHFFAGPRLNDSLRFGSLSDPPIFSIAPFIPRSNRAVRLWVWWSLFACTMTMQCWCGFCRSFAPSWPFVRCWLVTEFEMQRLGSEIAHETWWRMWQIYANLWMLVDVRYALLPISAYRYLYCTCMCGVCVCATCWCDFGVCIWSFICYLFIIHMHMHAYIKVWDEPNNCLDATVSAFLDAVIGNGTLHFIAEE